MILCQDKSRVTSECIEKRAGNQAKFSGRLGRNDSENQRQSRRASPQKREEHAQDSEPAESGFANPILNFRTRPHGMLKSVRAAKFDSPSDSARAHNSSASDPDGI
jgi:hypothetical protein